ncbi:oligosaccharide flippase family protein [Gammaproteobacteria bacterium]|nr:oligosaccharide flippase family protein [Gammaproteobacteria bacterium]
MPENRLLKSTSVYFGANMLNGLLPLLLLPVLTRVLSVESFGEIAIFQTAYMAFGALVGSTIAESASRKFFDEGAARQLPYFIGSCIQVSIVLSLITSLIIYTFYEQISEALHIPPSYLFYSILIAFMSVIIQIRLGQWQVRNKSFAYGALQVSQSALIAFLTVSYLIVIQPDAFGRVLSQLIVCISLALFSIFLLKKDGLLNLVHFNPSYIRESLTFGIPLIPHVVGVFLLSMFDRFFIAGELGIAQSGIYMLAAQLATIVSIGHESLNKAFVPWLFDKLQKNRWSDKVLIVKLTYLWLITILLTAPLFFIVGPYLVVLVAGPEYASAGKVFGWLALGHSFGGMYAMLNGYIYFSKITFSLSGITIASGAINIVLLILLIPRFGIEGAGIAFSASMFLRFILTWSAASISHPMPWTTFLSEETKS